ncbi:MAG: hypothetical protein IJB24_07550 [Clostridia bacterium]|nr:hypothetical protein [Clostridia bacterium]
MKIVALIAVVLCISLIVSFCCSFGEVYIDDIGKYGRSRYGVELQNYFPSDIKDYTVNAYSYRVYAYLDISYEILLDITVTEEQLDEIIEGVKKKRPGYIEVESYYADGYKELVFSDEYRIDRSDRAKSEVATVEHALIEKVVYNTEELRIVFIDFNPFDSYVYPLEEVEYFNIFGIDEEEYLHWLNVRAFEMTNTRIGS